MSDLHDRTTDRSAARRVKIPHLVFGLLFLGVVGLWGLILTESVSGEALAVLLPGLLIAAGVVGLVTSLVSSRADRPEPADHHDHPQYAQHPEQTGYDEHEPTEEIR